MRYDLVDGGLDCFFNLLGAPMVVSDGPEPARPSGGKGVRNKIDEPEEDWLRQRGPRC